ncbi:MAG: DUF1499 domain-containing protein [Promethearchaeota archaeon]|jgi:uncharacterized protein (DUF1499 family)
MKSKKPIGIKDGKFHPCPKSPNCVSTQSNDEKHKMEPLSYDSTLDEAKMKIKNIIESFKRIRLISEEENYLHYEFRTATFKFVDDVEFLFDDSAKLIHFRSRARMGWSDMHVNKNRMKKVSELYINA